MRGGGLCVDNSMSVVSPRIRALQDRLLDSLPVEGAWECLSPPQRDAIISIHRSRLTPEGYNRFPKDAKWKHKNYSEFSKYGRSRSFEDKLESETDDSGVRLASGTSTSNSLEDDSSDPGVKKSGCKFKSPKIDSPPKIHQNNFARLNRYDNTRRPLTKPKSSKLTLDCRNLMDKNRLRVDNVFSSPYNKNYDEKTNLVSRRNILEKHKSPVRNYREKNSISSEECGSPRRHRDGDFNKNIRSPHFRYPSTDREEKLAHEYDPWSKPRNKDMYSPNLPQKTIYSPNLQQKKNELASPNHQNKVYSPNLHQNKEVYSPNMHQNKEVYSPNVHQNKEVYSPNLHQNKKDLRNKKDRISSDIRLNMFDYRNKINQDYSKYSSNWNNIILDNNLSIKPTNIPSTLPPKSLVNPYNSHEVLDNTYPIEEKTRKYVRSKSLDRKYLDDSSDDDDDFSNRRRLERMKRCAKSNAEWEEQLAYKGRHVKRQRSKSAWDLTDRDEFDDPRQNNAPCSRKNILSKWKSEDADLTPRPNEFSNLRRYYGEGRSLEDLDGAQNRYKDHDLSRQRWRRSHDFELDRDESEFGPKHDEFAQKNVQRKRYVEKSTFYPATDHKMDPRLKSPVVQGKQYPPYYNRVNVPPPSFMYQKPKSRGLFSGKLKIFKSILSF